MSQPHHVAITVHLPGEWVRDLEALVDPDHGLDDVAAELADHAEQAVYRPGAWERWLCQERLSHVHGGLRSGIPRPRRVPRRRHD